MRRKVIQIANSTQLISLPRKWAQERGIKKGDELLIDVLGNSLVIKSDQDGSTQKEIDLDVTGVDRTSLISIIRALYRKGYSTINLQFKKPMAPHFRADKEIKVLSAIHKEVSRLTGVEIVKQTEDYCQLRCLSEVSTEEFDNLVRRVFLLLVDAWKDFMSGIQNHDLVLLDTIDEKHDTVTKFISYCMRSLSLQGYKQSENLTFVYHVLSVLENVTDILMYSARDLISYKEEMSKQTKKILKQVDSAFHHYYKLYYEFDLTLYSKISQQRTRIRDDFRKVSNTLPNEEIKLLTYFDHAIELLFGIAGSRASIEF